MAATSGRRSARIEIGRTAGTIHHRGPRNSEDAATRERSHPGCAELVALSIYSVSGTLFRRALRLFLRLRGALIWRLNALTGALPLEFPRHPPSCFSPLGARVYAHLCERRKFCINSQLCLAIFVPKWRRSLIGKARLRPIYPWISSESDFDARSCPTRPLNISRAGLHRSHSAPSKCERSGSRMLSGSRSLQIERTLTPCVRFIKTRRAW